MVSNILILSFSLIIIYTFLRQVWGARKADAEELTQLLGSVGQLTNLGILGTFVGICIGLFQFDPNPNEIDKSVINLLDAMRFAFITSVLGLFFSILSRRSIQKRLNMLPKSELTQDPLDILKEIRNVLADTVGAELAGIRHANGQLLEQAQETHRSIGGENENSLIGEIRNMRLLIGDESKATREMMEQQWSDQTKLVRQGFAQTLKIMVQNNKTMVEKFDEFANQLAENNTQALIGALEGVIRDFNEKISEQFGNNFQHLNEAVGKLLIWQEQNREAMDQVVESFGQSASQLRAIQESVTSISEQAQSIPEAMEALQTNLQIAATLNAEFSEYLDAIRQMKEDALQAFPVIQENLTNMTTHITTQTDRLAQLFETQNVSFEKAINNFDGSLNKYREETTRILNSVRQEFQNAVDQSNQVLNKAIEQLDKTMQDELERTFNVFAGKLGALSEQFVTDYTPLTSQLRNVLEFAQSLPVPQRSNA